MSVCTVHFHFNFIFNKAIMLVLFHCCFFLLKGKFARSNLGVKECGGDRDHLRHCLSSAALPALP